jgi:GNAT superfamily N-acetyltransferase
MNIGLFTIDEYDELIDLWSRCGLYYDGKDGDSRERIEEQVYDDRVILLMLRSDEGDMIGSVIGSYDGLKGWINRLAIDPDYRGHRLAARLLEKIEEMLAEMGAQVIAALIEDENFPSMAAFKFCEYEGWEEIVYFRKKLK